jgi:hypothetical protein
MIFYTILGPSHLIEIHEDKIILMKRTWLKLVTGSGPIKIWKLDDLAQFNITIPQYLLWGKVEWKSFDGHSGAFRFSTNTLMMKKIELYLQKKILKNHQKNLGEESPKTKIVANLENGPRNLAA